MKAVTDSRIFISYSHAAERREPWKARLLEQLRIFTDHHLIDAWDDERIPGGYRWEKEPTPSIPPGSR